MFKQALGAVQTKLSNMVAQFQKHPAILWSRWPKRGLLWPRYLLNMLVHPLQQKLSNNQIIQPNNSGKYSKINFLLISEFPLNCITQKLSYQVKNLLNDSWESPCGRSEHMEACLCITRRPRHESSILHLKATKPINFPENPIPSSTNINHPLATNKIPQP